MADHCGHRIMDITSAFQADDAGSIPADRSSISAVVLDMLFVYLSRFEQQSTSYVLV